MPTRNAHAEWNGPIDSGEGTMEFGSGAFEGPYSFESRMEDGPGTNPEELIGAAPRGLLLDGAVARARRGRPHARVDLDRRQGQLRAAGRGLGDHRHRADHGAAACRGSTRTAFRQAAEAAKENCPVSVALKASPITLNASLE